MMRPEPEPFVSPEVAAEFLGVTRHQLLCYARMGMAGCYPIGTGSMRQRWRFRLSELSSAVEAKRPTLPIPPKSESGYDPGRHSSLR